VKPVAEEPDEMLWMVDSNNKVLGSIYRAIAHDKLILHREIALLIYDENYCVLFQKRSMNKRANPGMWSTSVAGHIRYDHEPLEELIREAEEEVGLTGFELRYQETILVDTEVERYFRYCFEVQVPSSYHFELNAQEVDEVKFYTEQELDQALQSGLPFYPIFVDYVRKFWERHL
jgi:isopentenyldiphosphate isomerase